MITENFLKMVKKFSHGVGIVGAGIASAGIASAMLMVVALFSLYTVLPSNALGASDPRSSGLAMVINQKVVTYKDILDMGLVGGVGESPDLAGDATLRQLIVESEILSLAMKQVRLPEPTNDDRDKYIQNILDAQGATREQLLGELSSSGVTYDAYKARITLELKRQAILQNVITPTVVISSRDIIEYGFGEYTEATPYIINIIYDPKYDTQVTDLFRDGLRDQELAVLSQIAQAVVVPYSSIGDIRDELQPLIKTLKAKTVSPVKVVDGNAYRFYVTDDPSVVASFYDLSNSILQELYNERVQATYAQWLEMQMRFSIVQVFD